MDVGHINETMLILYVVSLLSLLAFFTTCIIVSVVRVAKYVRMNMMWKMRMKALYSIGLCSDIGRRGKIAEGYDGRCEVNVLAKAHSATDEVL